MRPSTSYMIGAARCYATAFLGPRRPRCSSGGFVPISQISLDPPVIYREDRRAGSSPMRSICPVRLYGVVTITLALLLAGAAPVSAQGFGIGPRLAWVHADTDADVDAVRFVGGQIRLVSQRFGLEVSLDHKSQTFELLNQKITETPIQASLLMRMGRGSFSPYLLGGPGWYRRKIEAIIAPGDPSLDATEFGWHAGIGLEIRPHKHFGVHGDYRYTFLDFKGDDDKEEGIVGRLLPGHRGSMWTIGTTIYF